MSGTDTPKAGGADEWSRRQARIVRWHELAAKENANGGLLLNEASEFVVLEREFDMLLAPSPAPLATGGEVDWRPAVAVAERHGAKWRKRAEKHVRPGGYRSEHQQHDLARAQICDHIAADIRALATSPTRVGDGGLRAHIEAALETIRTRHAEERAEADAGQLGTIKVANSGGRRDGLREAGDLIRAALRASDAGGGPTREQMRDRLKDAVEGECEGLALTDSQAETIVAYQLEGDRYAPLHPAAGGRGDEGVQPQYLNKEKHHEN